MSDDQDKKIDAPGGPIAEQRRHQRMEVPEHLTVTIIGEDSFENDDIVELHVEGYGKIPARVAREFVEGIGVEFELDEPEKNDMEEELKKFRLSVARKKY